MAAEGNSVLSAAIDLWFPEEQAIIRRYAEKGFFKQTSYLVDGVKPVNLEYLQEPDKDLNCPICYEPVFAARMLPCGHIFCKDCLNENAKFQLPGVRTCPYCRTEVSRAMEKDEHMRAPFWHAQLEGVLVKCPNDGCGMTLARYQVARHVIKHCPFTELDCPDDDCSRPVVRKYLSRNKCGHDLIDCPRDQCDATYERWEEAEHRRGCAATISNCESCTQRVPLEQLDDHRSICKGIKSSAQVCSAAEYGCRFTGDGESVTQHESECAIIPLSRIVQQQGDLIASHAESLCAVQPSHILALVAELEASRKQQEARLRDTEQELIETRARCTELMARVAELDASVTREIPALHVNVFNTEATQKQTNLTVDGTLTRLASESRAQWEHIEALKHAVVGSAAAAGHPVFIPPHLPPPPPHLSNVIAQPAAAATSASTLASAASPATLTQQAHSPHDISQQHQQQQQSRFLAGSAAESGSESGSGGNGVANGNDGPGFAALAGLTDASFLDSLSAAGYPYPGPSPVPGGMAPPPPPPPGAALRNASGMINALLMQRPSSQPIPSMASISSMSPSSFPSQLSSGPTGVMASMGGLSGSNTSSSSINAGVQIGSSAAATARATGMGAGAGGGLGGAAARRSSSPPRHHVANPGVVPQVPPHPFPRRRSSAERSTKL